MRPLFWSPPPPPPPNWKGYNAVWFGRYVTTFRRNVPPAGVLSSQSSEPLLMSAQHCRQTQPAVGAVRCLAVEEVSLALRSVELGRCVIVAVSCVQRMVIGPFETHTVTAELMKPYNENRLAIGGMSCQREYGVVIILLSVL
jgi:hypothetical protein